MSDQCTLLLSAVRAFNLIRPLPISQNPPVVAEASDGIHGAMLRTSLKFILAAAIFAVPTDFVLAQSRGGWEKKARDVLERFCKIDWEGKLLISESDAATGNLLITPHRHRQDQEVVVVDSYVLLGPSMQGRNAHFNVDYRVWGTIDSTFRFTREEEEIPNAPVKDRESYDLVFTREHNDFGQGGPKTVVNGPYTWRIGVTPSRARVSVEAAIRYLEEVRGQVQDPVIKRNAETTIAALERVAVAKSEPYFRTLRQTPVGIVKRYLRMELDGKQLNPIGWEELSTLFVQPGPLHLDIIDVMKEVDVGHAYIHDDENSAEVSTGSFRWGQLNSKTVTFERDALRDQKILSDYLLVPTDQQEKEGPKTGVAEDADESPAWKISGPLRQPQISVDTAIHYVTDMRDKTTDPVIKKNAGNTLAKLKALQ